MHKQWIRMEQIYLSFQRYLNRYLQVVTAQWCWRNTRVLLERYYSILKQVDIARCCETDFAVTTFEILSLESSVHWKQGLQILRFQGLCVVCFFFWNTGNKDKAISKYSKYIRYWSGDMKEPVEE